LQPGSKGRRREATHERNLEEDIMLEFGHAACEEHHSAGSGSAPESEGWYPPVEEEVMKWRGRRVEQVSERFKYVPGARE
jgi:hypothetical protein